MGVPFTVVTEAKGTHPGIVEKDVFDAAQTLIAKRKDVFAKVTIQNIYPLTSRIQCSECGSFYRRRIVSGTVKWVCSLHKDDSTACDSNYYSEERIYDGFLSMVNKLRFSEDNILGQVISRLEMTLAAMKRNNLAARDLSKSIAELNRVALHQPPGLRQEILQRFPHHYGGQATGGHRSSGQQV